MRTTRKKKKTSLAKRQETFQLTQPFLVLNQSLSESYAGLEPIDILLGLLESLIYEVHGNKRCAFV